MEIKNGTKIQAENGQVIEVVSGETIVDGFVTVSVKMEDGSIADCAISDLMFFIEKKGAKII